MAGGKLPGGLWRDAAGRLYWVKRVPKRFAGIVLGRDGRPVQQVRQCLYTDSVEAARVKVPGIETAKMAEWEAMAAGNGAEARAHYEAARRLAEARGFAYRTVSEIAEGDLAELVTRVRSLEDAKGTVAPAEVADAVLGAVAPALPDLREVLSDYFGMTESRHVKKAPHQRKKFEADRTRAVEHFCEATQEARADGSFPAPPVNRINRAMATKFRGWCLDRVKNGGAIHTQNKEIGALSDIVRTWAKVKDVDIDNPFAGLRLEGKDVYEAALWTSDEIRERLLKPGALDGTNAECRDILLCVVNTGIRPSELLNARRSDLVLDHSIPHMRIRTYEGRGLKQEHTAREIPLCGVSLEAAKRLAAADEWLPRYGFKGNSYSATINKYLREAGVAPTDEHTVRALRHGFEDRLENICPDDRIRADIMGHKYARPKYGRGGALVGRLRYIKRIAF